MAARRTRTRLDDWMRPHRGGRYAPREVTAKDRRSMAGCLLFVAVAVPTAMLLLGVERGLSMSAGALVISVFYLWRLWRTRHLGWRTAPSAQTATAPTP